MWVKEDFVNATKNQRFSDSPWYETRYESPGDLYRSLQGEYGRCVSRIYRDPDARPVGWVFQKRMEYEDARRDWPADRRFYIREVWVEVSDGEPPRS